MPIRGVQMIIGHMGEGLPISMWRVDNTNAWVKPRHHYPAKKKIADYFHANFYITTSGNFRTQSLIDAMLEIGTDRILFSTDWPFENIDHAADWFDVASISENDRLKIGRTNAMRLFNWARVNRGTAQQHLAGALKPPWAVPHILSAARRTRRSGGVPPGPLPSKSLFEDFAMSRVPSLSSPFLLGFDEIERMLDRVTKGADGYPPYNIERLARDGEQPERLRITLAVAGLYQRPARSDRRGEPTRHSRAAAGRQGPSIPSPRHCGAPVPAQLRAG